MACNHLNFLLESCKTVLHIEYGKDRSFVGNAQLSFEKNQALKKTLIKTGFFLKNRVFLVFFKILVFLHSLGIRFMCYVDLHDDG